MINSTLNVYLKGRQLRVYKFSRKQNFARINFRDWRFQLFRGNLFSRISRMKKFLCISRGEIFANFASRRFFKLWWKLIFELRPSHIRPRRGPISFWSSYHTITSSECTYHQWPPTLGITFNNINNFQFKMVIFKTDHNILSPVLAQTQFWQIS